MSHWIWLLIGFVIGSFFPLQRVLGGLKSTTGL